VQFVCRRFSYETRQCGHRRAHHKLLLAKVFMPPDPNLIVHEVFSWVIPGLVIMVLGLPVVRLITRWLEPKPVPPRELSAINERLERIEAAVDTIAVEIERISEAQRFSARLQSEQQAQLPRVGE
jgi:hypothetical protein